MDLEPKTENDGPVDQTAENTTDNQNGESSPHPNLHDDAKEEDPHPTHSFKWCLNGKTFTLVTCNKAGTVEDSLKISSQFREAARKNSGKELVILRDGKAVSSHFPCSLIKTEDLSIVYVKSVAKKNKESSGSVHPCRKRSPGEFVTFHIVTKGGKNVVRIMRNPALKTVVQEITLYAYKGEKVKQALKRDGRFQQIVFKKNCVLLDSTTHVITEMSNLVDDLAGKTYKIILLNKDSPPSSQPCSLEDAYMMPSESDGNQGPSEPSNTTESVKDDKLKNEAKITGNKASEIFYEIQDSEKMKNRLSSQFQNFVKGMKTVRKLSRIQNLFRVEYGKNAQTCTEIKTMKKLMELSSSVCQVRINGRPEGSGFLLFDRFVLTNRHVLKNMYHENRVQHDKRVTVNFSFESLDQKEIRQKYEADVDVEEVVGSELYCDVSGYNYDWALLKLSAVQALPDRLLTHFSFPSGGSGGICIIGHPDTGVKKIDTCVIIPSDNPSENQGNIQLITRRFFEDFPESMRHDRHILTYKSCFYFGSSGSPVFDKYCNVVAMHSGGYGSEDRGVHKHVIEYGYRLSDILEHLIVQLVEQGKFDVLKAYLACSYANQKDMMGSLKKVVESRQIIAFKNALSSSVVTNDEGLKMFFEFFSQTEEPVPMNIN